MVHSHPITMFLLEQFIIFLLKFLMWFCMLYFICVSVVLLTIKIDECHRKFLDYLKKRRKALRSPPNFKSIQHQTFSLPYHYMLYIAEKPYSPKALEKLQKTCKFFFSKKQILIVDTFDYIYDESTETYGIRKKYWTSQNRPFDKSDANLWLDKLPNNALFWLIRDLKYYSEKDNNIGSLLLPKVYKISLKKIGFTNLTLSEMEFEKFAFSGKLENLILQDVTITNFGGHNLTWLEIYEKFPYLTEFDYWNPNEITTVETIQNLDTIEHKTKIKSFILDIIVSSPFYNLIYLWKFIKDNAAPPQKCPHYSEPKCAYFRFQLKNANGETDFLRAGKTSFGLYRIMLAAHPFIIPHYDEKKFFENNVIQRLV